MGKIAGIISAHKENPEERLKTMLSYLKPAQGGISQPIIYSFQNLSIGAQNASIAESSKKTVSCLLVGELLRKEKLLKAMKKEASFFQSDAALIVSAYELIKTDLFHYIDGDFAFVLLDETKKELLVARDRLGGNDLFWCSNAQGCIFSSSLKALLSTGLVSQTPSNVALASFLAQGFISQDRSPILGVNRLLAGYYMKITLDLKISIHHYWSFSSAFQNSKQISFSSSDELFKEIRARLFDSVNIRMKKDHPCGAVENSTISANIIQDVGYEVQHLPLPTFSVTLTKSENVSPKFLLTSDHVLESIIPLIWSMETPVSDPCHLIHYQFTSWCHRHNLTPFFDTGFESEFFDYSSPIIKHVLEEKKPSLFHKFNIATGALLGHFFPRLGLRLMRKAEAKDPRIRFLERKNPLTLKEFHKAAPALSKFFESDLFLHEFYHLSKIESEPASLFYLTVKTEIIDKLNTISYKLAYDHGVTAEAPFLDLELLEFLASLEDGVWASPDMLASFPSSLLKSEKMSPPTYGRVDFNQLLSQPEMVKVYSKLQTGLLVESGFISKHFLQELLLMKTPQSPSILYHFLILELWMRLFIDLPLSRDNVKLTLQDLL